jgi:hypothetical protein
MATFSLACDKPALAARTEVVFEERSAAGAMEFGLLVGGNRECALEEHN